MVSRYCEITCIDNSGEREKCNFAIQVAAKTPKTTKRTRSSFDPTETPTKTRTLLRRTCAPAVPLTTRRCTPTNSMLKSRRRLAPSSATLKTCVKLFGGCLWQTPNVEYYFCEFINTYSGNIKSIKIDRRNYTAEIQR